MIDDVIFYPSLFIQNHIKYNDEFDNREVYRPFTDEEESGILIHKSDCGDFSFAFHDKNLDYITKQAPEIMKLTQEEIFELAKKNLLKFYKTNSEFTEVDEGLFKVNGGLFLNSFILLDDFWKKMHKELGKSIIFVMPTYGILYCFKESDRRVFGAVKNTTLDVMNGKGEDWSILTRGLYLKKRGISKIYRLGKLF